MSLIPLSGCSDKPSNASAPDSPTSSPRAEEPAALAPSIDVSERLDPGLLLMLVPNGQAMNRADVTAWVHAASENGVRLQPVTDQQFMALGAQAQRFAGLILPDQLHTLASTELLQAVRDYTLSGGRTLLVYDFGAYALDGNQKPTYAIPHSRLSDLAGVNYVLYDALRENSTVLGPVTARMSVMRELQVPPGKSTPYPPGNSTLPGAASPAGPASAASAPPASAVSAQTDTAQNVAPPREPPATSGADAQSNALHAYSGYLLGPLSYSSFVTQGAFDGKVLATSPTAGLVAGVRRLGRGRVMFVNLPLTYLKVVRTDALPMHGFLHYFAHDVVKMARLSAVPNAVPGLTLNWHLDSFAAQLPTLTLEKLGVFNDGPFSVDMTAGPDAVQDGDRLGWDLDNNPAAQDILRRLVALGHAVGSHGGWNHDYYGLQANEKNQDKFLPYLERNAQSVRRAISHPLRPYFGLETPTPLGVPALFLPVVQTSKSVVDRLLGPPLREYSPPVGNNPTWAMDWLEQQGVVAAYFAGHTGLGPTRQYRDGQLRNPRMWVFPVTPAGKYATFEEFQTNNVPKKEVLDWYRDSVDFAVAQKTTRMIYMHPNGATVWPDVLQDLLGYAKSRGSAHFRWYTMTRLADFMTTRDAVTWSEQLEAGGVSRFDVSHPSSLSEMVWLLPKTRYPERPVSANGSVAVADHGVHWAVSARNTRTAQFSARALDP